MRKIEDIDERIHELSRVQFMVLSDIACGTSSWRDSESRRLSEETRESEIEAIIKTLEVPDLKIAVKHYCAWMDHFEGRQNAA